MAWITVPGFGISRDPYAFVKVSEMKRHFPVAEILALEAVRQHMTWCRKTQVWVNQSDVMLDERSKISHRTLQIQPLVSAIWKRAHWMRSRGLK